VWGVNAVDVVGYAVDVVNGMNGIGGFF
jgi:hypothetical protein